MIKISSLNKTFGKNKILKDIQLQIPQGSLFALLGPNGSGKSTFLKCLLDIVPADSKKFTSLVSKKECIGYVPQNPAFPKNVKVCEIIDFFEYISPIPVNVAYKKELMQDMGILSFTHKNFSQLSQGMKQKVNILQCFMFNSSFIIMDEPTAGLDPAMSYYVKRILRQKKEEKKTVLFTSHIMSEVEELADEVAVLIEGEIVLCDKPTKIIQNWNSKNLEEAIRVYWRQET